MEDIGPALAWLCSIYRYLKLFNVPLYEFASAKKRAVANVKQVAPFKVRCISGCDDDD